MGAQHSTGQDKPKAQGHTGSSYVKTCYYEQLGVARQASDDEIKKAYRRKALELHPDRNYGDVEASTKQFAEIQSAYQILSDPQERAWYDSHRDAILRGNDVGSDEHFENNMRFTSATELTVLMGKFSPNMPFTDNPNGFYGSLRSVFETITEEENAVCSWEGLDPVEYPTFGIAGDSYDHVVKPFYTTWASFATRKTFSWKEIHNFADAPDRRVRRLMEKENKRLRDEGIKEFNDAVRSLIGFVRKRDPRYTPNKQSEADRQQALRDAAAAQASRSRAIHEAKLNEHVEPAWAQTSHYEEEGTFSDSEQSEKEVVECVTCNKIFKSEKQYEVHEGSKKHIKAVQQLMRQMRKEDKLFRLDNPSSHTPTTLQSSPCPSNNILDDNITLDAEDSEIELDLDGNEDLHTADKASHTNAISSADEAGSVNTISEFTIGSQGEAYDGDYVSKEQVEGKIAGLPATVHESSETDGSMGNKINNVTLTLDSISISSSENINGAPTEAKKKLGKAKAKRAKKMARQQVEDDAQKYVCATCNSPFSSKTKLFSHIKEEDHATFVPKPKVGSHDKISHRKP